MDSDSAAVPSDVGVPSDGERPLARRTLRRRMLALTLGLIVALAAAEGGLRAYHAWVGTYDLGDEAREARTWSVWQRSDDPELAYVHRPGYPSARNALTEASGLLSPTPVPLAKPDGVRRIALVGDSVGAALEQPHAQRFSTILEQLLRESGEAVEVLNHCVNRYGTTQEARMLETSVGRFDVDIVLLQYCINDPLVSYTPLTWFIDPDPPACFTWETVTRATAALAGGRSELPYVPKDTHEDPAFWSRHYEPTSEPWQRVCAGFDRVAAWSTERDVPVLVAVVPLFIPQDPLGTTSRGFREQVADAARARGLASVDVQLEAALRVTPAMQMFGGDPYHPSAPGHEAIASGLVEPVRRMLTRLR